MESMQTHRCPSQALVLALIASLGLPVLATRAQGQDSASAKVSTSTRQSARTELWLALSATLITAGAAGSFALKVAALHDRKDGLPESSPEGPTLDQRAADASRYAIGFGTVSSLLLLTSALLWAVQPGPPDAANQQTGTTSAKHDTTWTPTLGAQHVGVLCRGSF